MQNKKEPWNHSFGKHSLGGNSTMPVSGSGDKSTPSKNMGGNPKVQYIPNNPNGMEMHPEGKYEKDELGYTERTDETLAEKTTNYKWHDWNKKEEKE